MVALTIIFLIHAILEASAGDFTGFRLVMRLIIDFVGIALFLYGICWIVVRLATKNELENYLVSELFKSDGLKRPRHGTRAINSDFYNEIQHSDEEVIDPKAKDLQTTLELENGRTLCARELNVSKLVASNRSCLIARSLVDKQVFKKLVQKKVSA